MKVEEIIQWEAGVFTYELYLLIIYVRVMNFFSDLLKAIVDFRMRKGISVPEAWNNNWMNSLLLWIVPHLSSAFTLGQKVEKQDWWGHPRIFISLVSRPHQLDKLRGCVLLCFSVVVISTIIKSKLGTKGLIWYTSLDPNPSLREVKAGSQKEAEAGTMDVICLLVSSCFIQLPFLECSDPPVHNWHHTHWTGHSSVN